MYTGLWSLKCSIFEAAVNKLNVFSDEIEKHPPCGNYIKKGCRKEITMVIC